MATTYTVKLEFQSTKANSPKEAIEDIIKYLSNPEKLHSCFWEVEDENTGEEYYERLPQMMNKKTHMKVEQNKNPTDWVLTDPSTRQYGRRISEKVFEFKEEGKDTLEIDLTEYTEQEIESCINSYGYTLVDKRNHDCIFECHEQEAYWLMAECIFEQNMDYLIP